MSRWPEEDKSTLCKLWTDGLSGNQIANAMNGKYTRCAVIGMAHRMKLEPRNPNMNRHLGGRRAETEVFIPKPYVPPIPVDEPAPIGDVGDFPADRTTCRYIHGDISSGTWRACGHPGYPWCSHHQSRFCTKPLTNQRRG